MNEKPELTLTIHLYWLQKIVKGEKKQEYRSLSDFYLKRFGVANKAGECDKAPKIIKLRAGYNKDSKYAIIRAKGVFLDKFENTVPDGFEKNDFSYTIEIDQILEHTLTQDDLTRVLKKPK